MQHPALPQLPRRLLILIIPRKICQHSVHHVADPTSLHHSRHASRISNHILRTNQRGPAFHIPTRTNIPLKHHLPHLDPIPPHIHHRHHRLSRLPHPHHPNPQACQEPVPLPRQPREPLVLLQHVPRRQGIPARDGAVGLGEAVDVDGVQVEVGHLLEEARGGRGGGDCYADWGREGGGGRGGAEEGEHGRGGVEVCDGLGG